MALIRYRPAVVVFDSIARAYNGSFQESARTLYKNFRRQHMQQVMVVVRTTDLLKDAYLVSSGLQDEMSEPLQMARPWSDGLVYLFTR